MKQESRQNHIMVVGAHAGDAEIMAGALAALYLAEGGKATFVHLTPGEKGHKTKTPEEYAAQKRAEAKAAAEKIGADVRLLPYKDAELPDTAEVRWQLCDLIRELKPNILVTHWEKSIHPDHTLTHRIVHDALFWAALPAIERPLPAHGCWNVYYAENWEDAEGFRPDTYVDITPVYEDWLACVSCYELFRGGISTFRYLDYYQALSITRGCLAGCQRAVALMAPPGSRVCKGKRLPHT